MAYGIEMPERIELNDSEWATVANYCHTLNDSAAVRFAHEVLEYMQYRDTDNNFSFDASTIGSGVVTAKALSWNIAVYVRSIEKGWIDAALAAPSGAESPKPFDIHFGDANRTEPFTDNKPHFYGIKTDFSDVATESWKDA